MKNAEQNRIAFRNALKSGRPQQFVGAFNGMVAKLIEMHGFDGVYGSGAVISNSLGLPDIGLTTLSEVKDFSALLAKNTSLPVIVDADTGFGETSNVVRTIQSLEEAGVVACHLEDQVNPKRCGHLDGKELVSTREMVQRISAAVAAKSDPNFMIIARTDAKSVEGIAAAIERAKAYVDAGADMIFPEALHDEKELAEFRSAIDVPLLCNMTEFGKTQLLSLEHIQNLGYEVVIYPVTMQRLAMQAVENGLQFIKQNGSQDGIVNQMQSRKRLYEVLGYDYYTKIDNQIK